MWVQSDLTQEVLNLPTLFGALWLLHFRILGPAEFGQRPAVPNPLLRVLSFNVFDIIPWTRLVKRVERTLMPRFRGVGVVVRVLCVWTRLRARRVLCSATPTGGPLTTVFRRRATLFTPFGVIGAAARANRSAPTFGALRAALFDLSKHALDARQAAAALAGVGEYCRGACTRHASRKLFNWHFKRLHSIWVRPSLDEPPKIDQGGRGLLESF